MMKIDECECEYDDEGQLYQCEECWNEEQREKCTCIMDEIDIYCEWCYC